MEFNDTISLKILDTTSLAATVKVVRKHLPLSIGDIQKCISEKKPIFICDDTEERDLRKILKLYKELTKAGCTLEVYEGDDLSSIENIQNLVGSTIQTRKNFGDMDDDEI